MKVPRLEPIAPRVWLLRGGLLRTMNAYLIEDDGQVVVFDAGEKGMAKAIAAAGARLGGISRVVLGHGDTDHRGSAPALSKLAPVVCHPDAVAQAEGPGGRDYWHMERLPPAIRLLHRFTHRFVWDGGPVTISGTVAAGERIAGFEVIELAGHAPGQIGLWRESDGVALVSDTVYLTPWPAARPPRTSRTRPTTRTRSGRARASAGSPRCSRGSSGSATSAR